MAHQDCCVIGCRNSKRKGSPLKFYSFPGRKWEAERKEAWIRAINRPPDRDGNPWRPSRFSAICSAHFIGGYKSNHPLNPGYIPSIFPPNDVEENLKKSYEKPREVFLCETEANKVFNRIAKKLKTESDPLALDESDLKIKEEVECDVGSHKRKFIFILKRDVNKDEKPNLNSL